MDGPGLDRRPGSLVPAAAGTQAGAQTDPETDTEIATVFTSVGALP